MAILDQQDVWAAYEELFYQKVQTPRDYGITQEAMTSLWEELVTRVSKDNRLPGLINILAEGTATYSDLDEFALLLGNHLGNAMYYTMPGFVTYPDGFLTKEIADVIIPAGLRTNYDAIVEYAKVTQKGLNERAKLGLNAVVPDYDYNRESGLIDYITAEPWTDRAKSFRDAVAENGQYYADESAKVNAKAHYDAGLQPVIKRIAAWRCCKWCSNLAGTYDYSPNMDTDVFRRHSNCNCKVLFDPKDGKGRLQNAHTKQWATEGELDERKAYGLGGNPITPAERLLRIPQIAASTVTQKIRTGQYSLKLSKQNYDKHLTGTRDYIRYEAARAAKGLDPPSRLTVSFEEAQRLIDTLSGTGIIRVRQDGTPTDVELVTCAQIIGEYMDKGQWHETYKAVIAHGKHGSHIYPIKGSKYD